MADIFKISRRLRSPIVHVAIAAPPQDPIDRTGYRGRQPEFALYRIRRGMRHQDNTINLVQLEAAADRPASPLACHAQCLIGLAARFVQAMFSWPRAPCADT